MNKPIVITIDGASASGKSTNAKLVAKRLGYVYVDTGAMYRTLAWQCIEKNLDPQNGSLFLSKHHYIEQNVRSQNNEG